ncbi:MAG: PHP domain-containing protein [Pseudomonadota bacterium]|nr:MAG: PHP domain-containing protein [Pseudomonadota bacterium]
MTVCYDLHSHSTASDGTLEPEELVRHACACGVQVLALTDHDEIAGLAQAEAAAAQLQLGFVPGIELSVTWGHKTIHIVGLYVDSDSTPLQAGIERLRVFREWRGEEIARRLEERGISGALEGARRHAAGQILSRTHFARFLVDNGNGKDVRHVFRHFLVQGKPGYVPGQWASLEEAVGWIRAAGGLAVIAHPARYKLSATRRRLLYGEFRDLGGHALEVVSGSHGRDDIRQQGQHARQFGLSASAGSDYHGPGQAYLEPGRLASVPEGCTPIWLTDAWAQAAALCNADADGASAAGESGLVPCPG